MLETRNCSICTIVVSSVNLGLKENKILKKQVVKDKTLKRVIAVIVVWILLSTYTIINLQIQLSLF